jgi:hypothetical protein
VQSYDDRCGGWDLNPRIPKEQGFRNRFISWLILSFAPCVNRDLRRWPGLATPADSSCALLIAKFIFYKTYFYTYALISGKV